MAALEQRLGEALRDPELAVRREVDAVRAARHLVGPLDRERLRIERRRGAGDAVVHPEGAAVGREEELVRAAARRDAALDVPVRGIDARDVVRAHVGDEELGA